jgi:hypothetical protein
MRTYRLVDVLLDPQAVDGGGTPVAAESAKAEKAADAPPPAPAPQATGDRKGEEPPAKDDEDAPAIKMTAEEYREFLRLKETVSGFEEKLRESLSAKEKERLRIQTEKEAAERRADELKRAKDAETLKLQEQLSTLSTRFEQAEKVALERELTGTVDQTVRGFVFVGKDDATRQRAGATFVSLANQSLVAEKGEDGKIVVRGKDGRPAAEVLSALAAEHDYLIARKGAPGVRAGGGDVPGGSEQDPIETYFANWRAENTVKGRGLWPVDRQ